MAAERFDALTLSPRRGLADRRAALRLLVRSGTAALVVLPRQRTARANCGRVDDRCREDGDCCRGARCRQRRCVCDRPHHRDCDGDGRCESLLTSRNHCGACNNRCGGDLPVCFHGNCCVEPGVTCLCSPAGHACDRRTCCQGGDCLRSGVCPP